MKGLQPSMQRVTVKSNVLMIFELFELSLCQVTVCHKLVSETLDYMFCQCRGVGPSIAAQDAH